MTHAAGHLRLRHGSWQLLRWSTPEPGRPKRLKTHVLGPESEIPTRAAARRAADRLLAQLGGHGLNAGTPMPWQDWCCLYVERHLTLLARSTRATRASMIRLHLEPPFRGRPVHAVTPAAAQAWVVDQHRAGAAPATTRARFSVLRRMLRAAADAGLAASPPRADRIDFPRTTTVAETIQEKAFTDAECGLIMIEASDPLSVAAALGRYAGLRPAEILGLTWSSIDLSRGTLQVRQQAQDGELVPLKSRTSAATLTIPAFLVGYLAAYRASIPNYLPAGAALPDLLFFAEADDPTFPMAAADLRAQLHDRLVALGLPKRGLHAFRHACAIGMARAGMNPEAIRRAMRHASLRVTAVYLSATSEDVAMALASGAPPVGQTLAAANTNPQQTPPQSNRPLVREDTSSEPGNSP